MFWAFSNGEDRSLPIISPSQHMNIISNQMNQERIRKVVKILFYTNIFSQQGVPITRMGLASDTTKHKFIVQKRGCVRNIFMWLLLG